MYLQPMQYFLNARFYLLLIFYLLCIQDIIGGQLFPRIYTIRLNF